MRIFPTSRPHGGRTMSSDRTALRWARMAVTTASKMDGGSSTDQGVDGISFTVHPGVAAVVGWETNGRIRWKKSSCCVIWA